MLVGQMVQAGPALHVQLQLGWRAGDQGRPRVHEQMAQLETAGAVRIILQVALTELVVCR
jgi:hypothetical protein